METLVNKSSSSRILALDILRGITIAGMILVNNPGSWGSIYAPLRHADWNGLTPTDLIFPFFMFIMGISTYISMSKSNFQYSNQLLVKIIKRTVVIFLIGLGISWFSLSMRTYHNLSAEELNFGSRFFASITSFEHLRILGVMQRLAICYCATALIGMTVKHKRLPYIIGSVLLAYFLILLFGDGFAAENNLNSVVYKVDKAILGVNHMYGGGKIIEPEGLLSSLPAIAHVLLGFWCGQFIMNIKDNHRRIELFFIIGTILTFAGFLLSYGCPINKKIWSPTFVLVTCGLASLLLGLLIWIIDIKKKKTWCRFFESFGVNPLFIYVFGGVLAILIGNIWFPTGDKMIPLKNVIYDTVFVPFFTPDLASFLFSLFFIIVCWLVGYILYKKKIYIKI